MQRNGMRSVFAVILLLAGAEAARAVEHVVFRRDAEEISVDGRLLVKAGDGGLLLMATDGTLWAVQPDERVSHTSDDEPFRPMTKDELSKKLLAELPEGFSTYETANYLICYNTSRTYAQWCGALFERLYRAFTNYWQRQGFDIAEPEFPLVAVVFANQRAFADYSKDELGDGVASVQGYYSMKSNRMVLYDLTGLETLQQFRGRLNNSAQINQFLARPEATQVVSAIVHEATHQIAFNCGLHERYSDCPTWFSEGIAVYFETPDLSSTRGWRGIGAVNTLRLARFREYTARRPAESLRTLIQDDERFRDRSKSLDAYAEAWALTYFLLRQHPKEYTAYLKTLSEKKRLEYDEPETRLKEFQEAFGDIEALDAQFLRYIQSLR